MRKLPGLSIIPKISTENAVAFLKSAFKTKSLELKIVTDMNRENEQEGGYAGAKFIKILQKMEKGLSILVYTSNKQ